MKPGGDASAIIPPCKRERLNGNDRSRIWQHRFPLEESLTIKLNCNTLDQGWRGRQSIVSGELQR